MKIHLCKRDATPSIQFLGRPAIVIQARMGSKRLPGKVLMPLGIHHKYTVLGLLIERLLAYFDPAQVPIAVATTENENDAVIVDEIERLYPSVYIYRGSENDVLSRYYQTCKRLHATHCVRITSDCPFVDPELVQIGLQSFQTNTKISYLSNTLHRTLPRGFDFEICTFQALEMSYSMAKEPFEREHVTPFLYKNREGENTTESLEFVIPEEMSDMSKWRVTLDTIEDYRFLQALVEGIEKKYASRQGPLVHIKAIEILQLFHDYPEWKMINQHILQKTL